MIFLRVRVPGAHPEANYHRWRATLYGSISYTLYAQAVTVYKWSSRRGMPAIQGSSLMWFHTHARTHTHAHVRTLAYAGTPHAGAHAYTRTHVGFSIQHV